MVAFSGNTDSKATIGARTTAIKALRKMMVFIRRLTLKIADAGASPRSAPQIVGSLVPHYLT